MSYKIYHSNSLREFVKRYSDIFHTNDLFGEQIITVIQNSNIASWLKLELTKQDGISMDLQFEFPENAIKQLIMGYDSAQKLFEYDNGIKTILFMDTLKVVLYKTLEELLVNGKKFPHLYDYIQQSPKRLFQLSDSIAGLFYHYGMNCPQMVASWDKNELYVSKNGKIQRKEDQLWQMELWQEVFNKDTPYLHISKVLNRILESGDKYNPENSEFGKCKVILFGSTFLGESAIKFFNYLSSDIEVHHFLLTPSKIYDGEVQFQEKSLLNKFSGLINGFTNISRNLNFKKERTSFFNNPGENTLLHALQQGIKDNSLDDKQKEDPITLNKNDESFKICKITGGWREIEILKDKILKLLDQNSNLDLTDIGVVAPDIDLYSSYIEGIFPEVFIQEDGSHHFGKKHIPYNIMGLKGGGDSPYTRGFLELLDIPSSDFNKKDILNIISNPCFMEKFKITNGMLELYINTINDLNIKWGIDKNHRKDLGYSQDSFNTWDEGFKRILLGIALKREDNVLIPYNLNDTQGIDSLGTLIHIIRSLYDDLYSLNNLKLFMDEWVLLVEHIMETYLLPIKNDLLDERERLSVKHQFRNILNLLDDLKDLSNFKNKDIPFSIFKSLLKEFVIKSSNSRGRYLTQGITFSSLKPLRAVPFKHIFVLGMNEDMFPGKEKVPSYDLRGIYDQKIDLSKKQNDKFAFLELILSASESLTLFYNGKNQITGEELQPSVVINELMEAINSNFENKDLHKNIIFEEHPLHNFDSGYFSNDSKNFSYNKKAFTAALAYSGEKHNRVVMDLRNKESEDKIEIRVRDLVDFIKNPIKTFFTRSEGLYLEDTSFIEDSIYENMDLDFLARWKFSNIILEEGLQSEKPLVPLNDSFFSIAEREGVFKNSRLTSNVKDDVKKMVENIDHFLQDNDLKGTEYKRVNRELNSEFKPIIFNIDGLKVSLTGELENIFVKGEECFSTIISLGSEKKMRVKHKITPYIYSLILFNHPEMKEKNFTAYSIGKEKMTPAVFEDSKEYRAKLEKIVKLYIQNKRNPVPLFPDTVINDDIIDVKKQWIKLSTDDRNFSPVRTCPYVKMAYEESIPEIDRDDLEDYYQIIYKELI